MVTVQFGHHLVEGSSLDFKQSAENNFHLWINGGPFHETAIRDARIIIINRDTILTGTRYGCLRHDASFIEYNGTFSSITENYGKDKFYDKIKAQRDSASKAIENLQKDYQKVLQAPLLLLKLADAANSLGKSVGVALYSSKNIGICVGNTTTTGNDLEQVIRDSSSNWLKSIGDTKEIAALKKALGL